MLDGRNIKEHHEATICKFWWRQASCRSIGWIFLHVKSTLFSLKSFPTCLELTWFGMHMPKYSRWEGDENSFIFNRLQIDMLITIWNPYLLYMFCLSWPGSSFCCNKQSLFSCIGYTVYYKNKICNWIQYGKQDPGYWAVILFIHVWN